MRKGTRTNERIRVFQMISAFTYRSGTSTTAVLYVRVRYEFPRKSEGWASCGPFDKTVGYRYVGSTSLVPCGCANSPGSRMEGHRRYDTAVRDGVSTRDDRALHRVFLLSGWRLDERTSGSNEVFC